MFAAHEASYQQSLRALRKKIGALHNSTTVVFKAAGETPSTGGNIKLLFMKFFIVLLLFLKVKLSLIPSNTSLLVRVSIQIILYNHQLWSVEGGVHLWPLAPPTVKRHLTGRWADQL